jgi:hypothetical protein
VTTLGEPVAVRRVRVGCSFGYRAEIDTSTVFQVQPSDGRGVRVVDEHWSIAPAVRPPGLRGLQDPQTV